MDCFPPEGGGGARCSRAGEGGYDSGIISLMDAIRSQGAPSVLHTGYTDRPVRNTEKKKEKEKKVKAVIPSRLFQTCGPHRGKAHHRLRDALVASASQAFPLGPVTGSTHRTGLWHIDGDNLLKRYVIE